MEDNFDGMLRSQGDATISVSDEEAVGTDCRNSTKVDYQDLATD